MVPTQPAVPPLAQPPLPPPPVAPPAPPPSARVAPSPRHDARDKQGRFKREGTPLVSPREAEEAVLFSHELDWDNMSVEIAVDIDGKQDLLAFFENPQAFAATKIKKGRGEVSVKRLSDDQKATFREAREKEVT